MRGHNRSVIGHLNNSNGAECGCYTHADDTESETEKKHGFSIRSEWFRSS
jgi:hypothetical protein